MIPAMSSITLFFISVDRNRMNAIMANAPVMAPAITDRNPPKFTVDTAMPPPIPSITSAAPRLEPALIPSMEESARGLLNTVCNISPDTASAAPVSIAVVVCGTRDCRTMYAQLVFSASPPQSMSVTADAGILTEP